MAVEINPILGGVVYTIVTDMVDPEGHPMLQHAEVTDYIPVLLDNEGLVGDVSGYETLIRIDAEYQGVQVTTIRNDAFSSPPDLSHITTVYIPATVTTIGANAFADCSGLTKVRYDGTLTQWNNISIASGNTPLLNATLYNSSGTELLEPLIYKLSTDGTSYSVTGVTAEFTSGAITIPNTHLGKPVTAVNASAFSGCVGLTSIVIPNSVTSIGSKAFSGCSSLKSITIPFIGNRAGVTNTDSYQYPLGYIFGTTSYTGGTVVKQTYYGVSTTSTTSSTYCIPTSLRSVKVTGGNILYGAFYNCTMLTSIVIPDSITTIGEGAFYNCTGITSIGIPDSVTTIGKSAFSNCTSLTNIEIPAGVTEFDEYTFYHCASLASVIIGDNVTSIGPYAFANCISLTSITIPNSVSTIYYNAFNGCSKLASVRLGSGITTIQGDAFYACSSLTDVYYSGNIAGWCGISFGGIASNPGYYADNLYIGGKVIADKLDIPATVTEIKVYAFAGCENLRSVTIPNSVTSIGSYAFKGCNDLTIYYTSQKSQWDNVELGAYNTELTEATLYYYSEPQRVANPKETCTTAGSYDDVVYWATDNGISNEEVSREAGVATVPATDHAWSKVSYVWGAGNGSCTATRTCGNDASHIETESATVTSKVTQAQGCLIPELTTYTATFTNAAFATQTKANVETKAEAGHNYESEVTDPTCTEQGYTTHTCTRCGDSYKDTYVAALGHNTENVPYSSDSENHWKVCTRCGAHIDVTAHTVVIDEAVDPTCTTTGLTEGSHCSVCGEILVPQESIPITHTSGPDGICPICGARTMTCKIEFDDEWIQESETCTDGEVRSGCHWNYDRIFYLTYEILDSSLTNRRFYYQFGGHKIEIIPTAKNNVYTYPLRFSEIEAQISGESILDYLDDSGVYLIIKAIVEAEKGGSILSAELNYRYDLKVPPQQPAILPIELVTGNPGEVKCSWNQPDEDYDINEARGYCIEIFHCPEGEEVFTQLNNLGWNEDELSRGKYYIEKISKEEIVIPDVEGEFTTFIFNKPNSELYIWEPKPEEKPEDYQPAFYFMPKQLGINPGDKYLFRVHPYNVYSSCWTYDEEGKQRLLPGTLLTSEGTSMEGKVSKGIVRVKTDNGWVEGQVWVMTVNGWKQAEAVYAKTENGWKEAQ